MAGINPCEETPGFRKIRICPQPDPKLAYAKAEVETPFGLCRSGWNYDSGKIAFDITVPYDTEAEVSLPVNGTVEVEGKTVSASCFHLSAGDYHFEF